MRRYLDRRKSLTSNQNIKESVEFFINAVINRAKIRLEKFPLGKRLLHGAFWAVLGTIASRALGLVAAIVAARVVGKMVYGELGIIQSTVGMLGTLAGFGMSTTAAKFVAELRERDPERAGRIITLSSVTSWAISLFLAVMLVILAPWLCQHTLAAPQLTVYVRMSAPLLVVAGINGAQLGVLIGFEAFKAIARVTSLAGLLNFPLVVGGALMFGLPGILGGMALAQGLGCILNFYALRREARNYRVPIAISQCWSELPILWQYSLPAVGTEIVVSAVGWTTATMLVRQSNGYSEMGVFNAANQWFNAAIWLPKMLGSVALPMLSERLGTNDRANSFRLLWLSVKINGIIVAPIVAFGCLLSPYIMMSYGNGFRSAWPTLCVILLTAAVLSVESPVGQLFSASGRMWLGFSSNVGWAAVFVCANLLLLGQGAFGLATARLLGYCAQATFIFLYLVLFIMDSPKSPPRITYPSETVIISEAASIPD